MDGAENVILLNVWQLRQKLCSPNLDKVPRVHLLESDLQVQYDVISSWDVSVLLLSVASKHEAKVTKEASKGHSESLKIGFLNL